MFNFPFHAHRNVSFVSICSYLMQIFLRHYKFAVFTSMLRLVRPKQARQIAQIGWLAGWLVGGSRCFDSCDETCCSTWFRQNVAMGELKKKTIQSLMLFDAETDSSEPDKVQSVLCAVVMLTSTLEICNCFIRWVLILSRKRIGESN